MHPIIIWSVCVLFSSSHRTIKAGNYFSTLARLLLAAAMTRDCIYPSQKKNVQWINAPLVPGDAVENRLGFSKNEKKEMSDII